jgi:hypothetical protein
VGDEENRVSEMCRRQGGGSLFFLSDLLIG